MVFTAFLHILSLGDGRGGGEERGQVKGDKMWCRELGRTRTLALKGPFTLHIFFDKLLVRLILLI